MDHTPCDVWRWNALIFRHDDDAIYRQSLPANQKISKKIKKFLKKNPIKSENTRRAELTNLHIPANLLSTGCSPAFLTAHLSIFRRWKKKPKDVTTPDTIVRAGWACNTIPADWFSIKSTRSNCQLFSFTVKNVTWLEILNLIFIKFNVIIYQSIALSTSFQKSFVSNSLQSRVCPEFTWFSKDADRWRLT